MPIRTGQNQLPAFTRPAQNERPITSAIVRGLGNTIGVAFNEHDADQSLHVQSGLLADRPLAGTLGRVFVTYDVPTAPLITLDNGTSWVSQSADWASISNRPTDFPPAHGVRLAGQRTRTGAGFADLRGRQMQVDQRRILGGSAARLVQPLAVQA